MGDLLENVKGMEEEVKEEDLTEEEKEQAIELKSTEKSEKKKESKYPLEPIDSDKFEIQDLDGAKQEITQQIDLFNFTISKIVNNNDYYNGNIKKSGVRKLQTAFNISTEIMNEKIWKEHGVWKAKYRVRARTPRGRFAECIGAAVQDEKRDRNGNPVWNYHDTIATAQTRATSRAILDLVGFGAVSAEEIANESTESVF